MPVKHNCGEVKVNQLECCLRDSVGQTVPLLAGWFQVITSAHRWNQDSHLHDIKKNKQFTYNYEIMTTKET